MVSEIKFLAGSKVSSGWPNLARWNMEHQRSGWTISEDSVATSSSSNLAEVASVSISLKPGGFGTSTIHCKSSMKKNCFLNRHTLFQISNFESSAKFRKIPQNFENSAKFRKTTQYTVHSAEVCGVLRNFAEFCGFLWSFADFCGTRILASLASSLWKLQKQNWAFGSVCAFSTHVQLWLNK